MIMIVKACIFSPSLTRQLHYHSQLDKSVAWFWKSNEDNLLWILWMRSQFTWKWPPTLIEVVCFTYFAAYKTALLYFTAYSRKDYDCKSVCLVQKLTLNFECTISSKQIRILSCMTGFRIKLKWLFGVCWFVLLVSQSWRGQPGTIARLLSHPVTEWLRNLSEDILTPQLSVDTVITDSLFLWHLWINNCTSNVKIRVTKLLMDN